MDIWCSHDQDRVWSRSHWSKRIDPDSKHIHWALETTTEERRAIMGQVHIHGTMEGDLTLAIIYPDE